MNDQECRRVLAREFREAVEQQLAIKPDHVFLHPLLPGMER
jgi:hypothetical protein